MPEHNESMATGEDKKPRTDNKLPKKIRISLFFDGTLNNRDNIEEREKEELSEKDKNPTTGSQIYKEFHTKGANSYDNGRTNIAIMEPHVSADKADYMPDFDLVYKAYIAGQGALTHLKDDVKGYAFAIGASGVPQRAEEGVEKAFSFILSTRKKEFDPALNYIEKLTIDVFGFSRGAATARYAIHVIQQGRILEYDQDTGQPVYEWSPLYQRLNNFNYEVEPDAVEIRFAGLYDTVLSYMGSQYMPRWFANNLLEQRAVAHAKHALHLAAADEHRNDFPLHKIKSAVDKGVGEEYFLPGVHSDVGGSYNQANEILLKRDTDDKNKQYMRTSDEGMAKLSENPFTFWGVKSEAMIINDGNTEIVKQDRDDLVDQGWYRINETRIIDISSDDYGNATRSALDVSRKGIHSSYCNIPLKIMAKAARDTKVKMIIDGKLEDRTKIILEKEPDLLELEDKIIKYMAANKNNSKPEDWKPEDWAPGDVVGKKTAINRDTLKAIRHKHFHFSASKMSKGYNPRFEYDKAKKKYVRKRFYYDG